MTKQQRRLLIIITALVFCIPAFYNGFPFLFPDSIGYISLGFVDKAGDARMWLYSGFVRHISLWETLWLVVLAQGLILAISIHLMFKYFFKKKYKDISFLCYSLVVGSTTAVSFHVGMIMPDIFTPLVILSFCLLLLAKDMTKKDLTLTILLFAFTSGTHNSHLILNIGLIGVLVLGLLIKNWRPVYRRLGITTKKVGGLLGLVICTYFLSCTLHYCKGGNFAATRGGGIFLFARLCDFGIAQEYMKENCVEPKGLLDEGIEHDFCYHSPNLKLGRGFLWTGGSYLYKKGGWSEEGEAFFGGLVWDILTTPKYFKKYLVKITEAMFMQFFYYDYNPLEEMKMNKNSGIMQTIKQYYPSYYVASYNNKQVLKKYTQTSIDLRNALQQFVISLSGLFVLLLLFDPNYSEKQKAIALLIILGLLINAFIVGATSGVYDRYQSRVAWLITLPAFWYIYAKVSGMFQTIKKSLTRDIHEYIKRLIYSKIRVYL